VIYRKWYFQLGKRNSIAKSKEDRQAMFHPYFRFLDVSHRLFFGFSLENTTAKQGSSHDMPVSSISRVMGIPETTSFQEGVAVALYLFYPIVGRLTITNYRMQALARQAPSTLK
jgi:hypothetical protein